MIPFMAPMMMGAGIEPVAAPTTWDPANSSANLTRSNGNRTVYNPDMQNPGGIKSIRSRNAGDLYYEIRIDASASEIEVGFSKPADNLLIISGGGIFYVTQVGRIYMGTSLVLNNLARGAVGDVIGLRYRFSDSSFIVYKNGTQIGATTAYSGQSPLCAALTLFGGDQITANFGQAAFTGGLPAGATII